MAPKPQRSMRWWVGVGTIAITAGVLAYFVLALTGGKDENGGSEIGVDQVEAGSPGNAAALWLLGRASLRFDPVTLRGGQLLNEPGFGSVLGAAGRVDFFDPDSGRLGALDSRRNEVIDYGKIPVEPGSEFRGEPVIADTGGSIWLVTGPSTVTRFETAGRRSTRISFPAVSNTPEPATRVAANSHSVYAVVSSATADGTVTRIDASTNRLVGSARLQPVVGSTPLTVRSFTADDRGVWVLGDRAMVRLDPTTLAVRQAFAYADPRLDLYQAAVVDGDIWGLDKPTSELVQLDTTGATVRRLPTRPGRGELPLPAGLVADERAVWVLAPVAPRTGFGAERLTRVDARTGRITGRFESPAKLVIGAVAVTSR